MFMIKVVSVFIISMIAVPFGFIFQAMLNGFNKGCDIVGNTVMECQFKLNAKK